MPYISLCFPSNGPFLKDRIPLKKDRTALKNLEQGLKRIGTLKTGLEKRMGTLKKGLLKRIGTPKNAFKKDWSEGLGTLTGIAPLEARNGEGLCIPRISLRR